MKHKRTESHSPVTAPAARRWKQAKTLAVFLAASTFAVSGCGGNSSKNVTPPATGSPVIIGTQPNSLPAAPAQSKSNRYAGIDMVGGGAINWQWDISQANNTYNYQEEQGVGGATTASGGTISSFGDFEYLTDTTAITPGLAGLNAEIPSGVSLFEESYGSFPQNSLAVGVMQQQAGCLAPDGMVNFNFVVSPNASNYLPNTDALYGSATLAFASDTFTFSGITQSAGAGKDATTSIIPFANSYCVQALSGYGIQSTGSSVSGFRETVLTYVGDTGTLVGAVNYSNLSGTATGATTWAGFIEPGSPIDLSSVTSASYKGFNRTPSYPDPVYFGSKSPWITTPVFSPGAGQLLGGYEDFINSITFGTSPAQVPGNILLDFGVQDGSHPGSFPAAQFTEQDPSNFCKPDQQSIGSDGLTYCTFPVVALVGESYGKYVIFASGPDPTTQSGLFYALIQD
jgi:hypothetical protein